MHIFRISRANKIKDSKQTSINRYLSYLRFQMQFHRISWCVKCNFIELIDSNFPNYQFDDCSNYIDYCLFLIDVQIIYKIFVCFIFSQFIHILIIIIIMHDIIQFKNIIILGWEFGRKAHQVQWFQNVFVSLVGSKSVHIELRRIVGLNNCPLRTFSSLKIIQRLIIPTQIRTNSNPPRLAARIRFGREKPCQQFASWAHTFCALC